MHVAAYVDDLSIVASCDNKLSKVKANLSSQFKMKDMGKLHRNSTSYKCCNAMNYWNQ